MTRDHSPHIALSLGIILSVAVSAGMAPSALAEFAQSTYSTYGDLYTSLDDTLQSLAHTAFLINDYIDDTNYDNPTAISHIQHVDNELSGAKQLLVEIRNAHDSYASPSAENFVTYYDKLGESYGSIGESHAQLKRMLASLETARSIEISYQETNKFCFLFVFCFDKDYAPLDAKLQNIRSMIAEQSGQIDYLVSSVEYSVYNVGQEALTLPPQQVSVADTDKPTTNSVQQVNVVATESSTVPDKTVTTSARYNVGNVLWLDATYPTSGSGKVRIIDSDMNLNSEIVDDLEVDVISDTDARGIKITAKETQKASGIFEGTVIFTADASSSGSRLRVSGDDAITVRYGDFTLPDSYTRGQVLNVEGTAVISASPAPPPAQEPVAVTETSEETTEETTETPTEETTTETTETTTEETTATTETTTETTETPTEETTTETTETNTPDTRPVSVTLDRDIYSWTDKVKITIVSPTHNSDSAVIDKIGETDSAVVYVGTRTRNSIANYVLVETGPNTGTFTGEVVLTGFTYNADSNTLTGSEGGADVYGTGPSGTGPTDGLMPMGHEDGIEVLFTYTGGEPAIDSAITRWNQGTVEWLASSYDAPGSGKVRITDPDMNWNPRQADSFKINVSSNTDYTGTALTVTETQESSNIFEGTVLFSTDRSSSGDRLRVSGGDTVTAIYHDNTLPDPHRPHNVIPITGTTTISAASGGANNTPDNVSISFDQSDYSWTDKVIITITAPDHNLDSSTAEKIGETARNVVNVSTKMGGMLSNYALEETGPNTGVFSGHVILTGFQHNADGSIRTGDGRDGYDLSSTPTTGTGPTGGRISASNNDGITVSFESEGNANVLLSAPIRWTEGTVEWAGTAPQTPGSGTVRITDPDMNWDPEALDSFIVDVTSDSDAGGIRVTVTETQVASGIFENTVTFSTDGRSSGTTLLAAVGDYVAIRYDDATLPLPYVIQDVLDIEEVIMKISGP